ncbi:MAG: NADP-dependent malic enzyme [Eubacteriales bacterium]|nr:NADP-dependent malic enzyme [Eubacteriales bacterium]
MDYDEESLKLHKKYQGKIEVISRVEINNKNDLSIYYTPGVASPCLEIQKDKSKSYDYTRRSNLVAVITDGSAVLGLGDIGPEASMPVMEGKCILFKHFANIDAFPICVDTKDVDKLVETIYLISKSFGGINLEDISAPRCFEIENKLKQKCDIPIFHDDQHGTAIVVLAGLINALKVTNKKKEEVKICISGAGAAGTSIAKILLSYGFENIIMCDINGIIYDGRENDHYYLKEISKITNKEKLKGSIHDAIKNRDIFIGVSKSNLINSDDIKNMNKDPIVFALANPTPEIMPDEAKKGGCRIIATGRSDFPNQINNICAFPGIFRGALDAKAKNIDEEMKLSASLAIANFIKNIDEDHILPNPLDDNLCKAVAQAVFSTAKKNKS